ncbi:MAG: ribose 5-phosphate isomerase B [Candidatus Aminicenantes bacterium]|nr:ribose 5-phosphate isomerase B [Candidatus Aminicenantes bacterium]
MKIAVASDHAGFWLKQRILKYLKEKGIEHMDFGCYSDEDVDYVDFAEKALLSMQKGDYDRAVLICGTGLGMGIVANKFKGVIATPCCDEYTAEMSRRHNNSNCLTLAGRVLPEDQAIRILEIWLNTKFDLDRHQRRLDKISVIEEKNFKS